MSHVKKKHVIRRQVDKDRNMYFSSSTQDSIIRYQKEQDKFQREKIYEEEILPAFDKLAENLIYMYGFSKQHDSVEALKSDCITFLYEQIHKYDHVRGTKAFSYFNVIARNYLIIKTKQKHKDSRRHISLDEHLSTNSNSKNEIEKMQIVEGHDATMIEREKKDEIKILMDTIKDRLANENEKICMDAVIKLFSQMDDLEFLNKRALFVYIREMSSLNSKQVSTAMSTIRRHYKDLAKAQKKKE